MAYSSLLSLSLGFLILFNSCFAQIEQVTSRRQHQQQRRRFQTECQIQNLNALEPQRRIESEAGVTEFWDPNNEQLQCANVAVVRHRIEQRGLLVPSYYNAPQLIYVVQGRGIHGAVFPGCPETFQSDQSGQSGSFRSQRGQPSRDQHQKIRHIREGDVIALPTGVAHWIYNEGQSQLVLVALVDLGNFENQLDQFYRKFVIAGSPQQEIQGAGWGYSQSESSRSRGEQGSRGNNILSAFNERTLADAFNIDTELARRLQRDQSQRGIIVRVQDELRVLSPQREEREREYESEERWERDSENGIEETVCTMRLRHNINNPTRADVYNPRGGRITTVNAFNLPVLRFLQLSAEKGTLYRNGLMAPHWNMNAHSIVYVVRGQGRLEIASENGERVFNGEIGEGQLVVVPQNYAVVKRASSQGFEWIAFKTNAYAKISQLAGRVSVMRALPVDVIRNAYDISREDAFRLKESRFEATVFSPGSQSRREFEATVFSPESQSKRD